MGRQQIAAIACPLLQKATVAWYGRLASPADALHPRQPLDLVGELKAPLLGLYGGQDQGIPLADIERMRAQLSQKQPASQLQLYNDAGHAFYADYRPSYRKAAADDGWQRLLQWFALAGVKP